VTKVRRELYILTLTVTCTIKEKKDKRFSDASVEKIRNLFNTQIMANLSLDHLFILCI